MPGSPGDEAGLKVGVHENSRTQWEKNMKRPIRNVSYRSWVAIPMPYVNFTCLFSFLATQLQEGPGSPLCSHPSGCLLVDSGAPARPPSPCRWTAGPLHGRLLPADGTVGARGLRGTCLELTAGPVAGLGPVSSLSTLAPWGPGQHSNPPTPWGSTQLPPLGWPACPLELSTPLATSASRPH